MTVIRSTTTAMLLAMLLVILTACSGKTADPINPDPQRDPAVESGEISLTLNPDDSVTIMTSDFAYDMDIAWDDGLVITNNGQTIYDFTLNRLPENEGEQEHFSAGIIETGMTTAALGIPLVEDENDFAIFIREEPSHIFKSGDIYVIAETDSDNIVQSPCGSYEYIGNQVRITFRKDSDASERHRIIRENNLFIIACLTQPTLVNYVGRIDDDRCPIEVANELSLENVVLEAFENRVLRSIWPENIPM